MAAQEPLFDDADAPAPAAAGGAARAGAAAGDAAGTGDAPGADAPLAERLRPRSLADVVGQDHLLGPGRPLRAAAEGRRLHSMVLWGPPGVGKTTLARLLAQACGARLLALSAVLSGVRDIREAVEAARAERAAARQGQGRPTVVFVDEVHRFNKAQQDAFLPHVESGLFTFIGATTENPSFEVNAALLSRASVHVLHALDAAAMERLLARAQALLAAPPLDPAARQRLVEWADGDARRLLNAYENLAAAAAHAGAPALTEPLLQQALGELLRRGDKGGDLFYDTISALHKSVRGSDPDAALYWLARLLDAGMDPRYAARRLLRMAVEDVGLADPRALQVALQSAEVYERLGSPEGELALAQAAVYLAVAPKSNAVYRAFGEVRQAVRQGGTLAVPAHLRNAPTRLMKDMGFGAGYRYDPDEPGGHAAGQTYLPPDLAGQRWYRPVERGLEQRIAQRLAALRGGEEPGPPPPGATG